MASPAEMHAAAVATFPNLTFVKANFTGENSRSTVRCNIHNKEVKSFTYSQYVIGDREPCSGCVTQHKLDARVHETAAQFDAYKLKYPCLDFSDAKITHITKRDIDVYCNDHKLKLKLSYQHNILADKSACDGCKRKYEARKWLEDNADKVVSYKEKFPNIIIDNIVFPDKSSTVRVKCAECNNTNDDFNLQKIMRLRHGCVPCSNRASGAARVKGTPKFIKDARTVHGDAYNYDKVKYVSAHMKVTIMCPKHGDFEQDPASHTITKVGCPKCGDEAGAEKNRGGFDDFLRKSLAVAEHKITEENKLEYNGEVGEHKYDYAEVVYGKNSADPVKIICAKSTKHDYLVFEQRPDDHYAGKGCPECGGTRLITTEEFIENAQAVHGNTYDYSLVEYVNNETKVKIKCAIHGMFKQQPTSHIYRECGCPVCSASMPERRIFAAFRRWGIKFKFQKRFDDCKDKNCLPFDFYIPVPYHPGIAIEYDGEQHVKEIKHWHGAEGFAEQQRKDGIKNMYCEENGIKLIRIKHDANLGQELIKIKRKCEKYELMHN